MKINIINTKNKKAQLKIQQTAFMLLAITLFFVLVGLLAISLQSSGLKKKYTETENENAMKLVSKLANSPEFSCGNSFSISRTDCLDTDKIMMLKQNIDTYSGFWDVAEIQIRRIWPLTKTGNTNCTMENYPDCDLIGVYKKSVGSQSGLKGSYVALCRKEVFQGQTYDKCEMGILMIGSEVKQ